MFGDISATPPCKASQFSPTYGTLVLQLASWTMTLDCTNQDELDLSIRVLGGIKLCLLTSRAQLPQHNVFGRGLFAVVILNAAPTNNSYWPEAPEDNQVLYTTIIPVIAPLFAPSRKILPEQCMLAITRRLHDIQDPPTCLPGL